MAIKEANGNGRPCNVCGGSGRITRAEQCYWCREQGDLIGEFYRQGEVCEVCAAGFVQLDADCAACVGTGQQTRW